MIVLAALSMPETLSHYVQPLHSLSLRVRKGLFSVYISPEPERNITLEEA